MKEYLMSVIAAALLSGIASLLSPEKWRKYIGIVTGLVLLCSVVSPILRIEADELFVGFEIQDELSFENEEFRMKMIEEELSEKICRDVEERLRTEFGCETEAEVKIGINKEGKITGVEEISVNSHISNAARERLKEVYGVEKIRVSEDFGFF